MSPSRMILDNFSKASCFSAIQNHKHAVNFWKTTKSSSVSSLQTQEAKSILISMWKKALNSTFYKKSYTSATR